MSSMVTERIVFSGRVQGVGFRWATAAVAQSLPVTGTVRNLSSGQVELRVTGTPATTDLLVARLQAQFGDNITRVERTPEPELVEFSDFRIQR